MLRGPAKLQFQSRRDRSQNFWRLAAKPEAPLVRLQEDRMAGGGRPSGSPLPARWQEGLSPEAARRVLDRVRHLEGRLHREALGEPEFEPAPGDAAYLDVGRAWQGAWHALERQFLRSVSKQFENCSKPFYGL